jgi:major membrane immunogen (membrane-anchored lipoprotein)
MKDGAMWLKDFSVESDIVQNNNFNPKPQYSMVLKTNSIYRFLIKSSPKFDGKAKLAILDGNIELKSTAYQSGKIPEFVDIEIKETKIYHILVTFQDGKKGCAAFDIYFVKNQATL